MYNPNINSKEKNQIGGALSGIASELFGIYTYNQLLELTYSRFITYCKSTSSPNNKPCRNDKRGCFDNVTNPLKSLFE